MKTCVPRRGLCYYTRRFFEKILGGLMLLVLYPIYGARELWRAIFVVPVMVHRGETAAQGIQIPKETPAQKAAYQASYGIPVTGRVSIGTFDAALGGGIPMGRSSFVFKDKLYGFQPVSDSRAKHDKIAATLPDHVRGPWNEMVGKLLGNQVADMDKVMQSHLATAERLMKAGALEAEQAKELSKLSREFDDILGREFGCPGGEMS
jgi:hypothetical protein